MSHLPFQYLAYGLHLASALELPELMPNPASTLERAELQIRAGITGKTLGTRDPEKSWVCTGRIEAILDAPEVGLFVVRDGQTIDIEPFPDVDAALLRAFLLGPVLAMALYQRGFLVLHASSVALHQNGQALGVVGFLGHSGHGKSTLAATLHARGHQIIGDDVIAVPIAPTGHNDNNSPDSPESGVPWVFPAYPQLRLWPQALRAVGRDPETLALLYPGQERRVQAVAERFSTAPLPLRRLYVLSIGEEIRLATLAPAQSLMQLVERAYLTPWLEGENAARQLKQCAALLTQIDLYSLQRPRDLKLLDRVAEMIENEAITARERN